MNKRFYICTIGNKQIKKLEIMTNLQKYTIDNIVGRVERYNGTQTVSVVNVEKGHVLLNIFNVRESVGGDVITTTTYVNVQINTKGKSIKGFIEELQPKVETVYPYMD